MIAANMPYLGDDHAISPRMLSHLYHEACLLIFPFADVAPDDGNLAVVVVDGACSRLDTIGLAMAMKKGVFLGEDPTRCRTFVVPEFKITPTDAKSPYNIDGDPHEHGPVHVKVLHQALTMFCLPSQSSSSSVVAAQVHLSASTLNNGVLVPSAACTFCTLERPQTGIYSLTVLAIRSFLPPLPLQQVSQVCLEPIMV
jgi:hypothetical protein